MGEVPIVSPLAVLGLRMALVAGFVVIVAVLAERMGPFLGGMIASLPLYTGPVYLMLALQHDAAWLLQATLGSIVICGANPVFVLVYCVLARRHGVALSLGSALLAWAAIAILVQAHAWTLAQSLLFVMPISAVSVVLAQSFTRGVTPARAERRWSDLLLRAVLVAALAGFTIWISDHLPPQVAGTLSVMPILLTSIVLVLQPRVGGKATAALLAHTLAGLVGMVLAFAVINVAIPRVGVWAALASGLILAVGWNVLLIGLRRARRPSGR